MIPGLLARLRGFEPPAYRLGGGRSIQLSYRRMLIVASLAGGRSAEAALRHELPLCSVSSPSGSKCTTELLGQVQKYLLILADWAVIVNALDKTVAFSKMQM